MWRSASRWTVSQAELRIRICRYWFRIHCVAGSGSIFEKESGSRCTLKQCFGSGSMWIRIEMAPKWIRIRIGNTDPDLGQSKWCPKREKNLWFQVKKNINHFAEGLMVSTWAWKSSINVLKQQVTEKEKKMLNFFFFHFGHENTWIRIRSRIRICTVLT